MLSRAEIDERLATWALDNSQREALETAQRLGEWLEKLFDSEVPDNCDSYWECDGCPWRAHCAWLRGEGK